VARKIEQAITARSPRTRYTVTPSARALITLRSVLRGRGWDAMLSGQFPRPGR
jgi:hypothetical protein